MQRREIRENHFAILLFSFCVELLSRRSFLAGSKACLAQRRWPHHIGGWRRMRRRVFPREASWFKKLALGVDCIAAR